MDTAFYKKDTVGLRDGDGLISRKAILKYRHGSFAQGFYRPQMVLFYLTRPLLLGAAPQLLQHPPLLRRSGPKAWPAGPVLANKLSPLKGLLVIAYAIELRLFDVL